MNKPPALTELLHELQMERITSDVDVTKTSKAVIYLHEEAAQDDDGIELSAKESTLVFSSASTVERLADALDSEEASLVLYDMEVSDPVLEELERRFTAIDEG